MDREDFSNYCGSKIILLDGATGTELQKRGMPSGVCPEKWVMDNPEIMINLQKEYLDSGSNILYSCTFGANKYKLKSYGLENEVIHMNKTLVEISKQAVLNSRQKAYIAGGMAPTGQMIYPLGETMFEDVVEAYKEQVKGLLAGGVNLFIVETMLNVQEARAAVLAIRECCNRPIMVSITVEENGKMLTGTDPVTALITLQSLGIDAFGINCSTGPDRILEYIKILKQYASIPLLAKPNAGVPILQNGNTKYSMGYEEFGSYAIDLVENGVNLLGGCCGTTPQFIQELERHIENKLPRIVEEKNERLLTSSTKTVDINDCKINLQMDSINNKEFNKALDELDFYEVQDMAMELDDENTIININISNKSNGEEIISGIINTISYSIKSPLCFQSNNPKVIETALRIYQGRGAVNITGLDEEITKEILPIIQYYGALII